MICCCFPMEVFQTGPGPDYPDNLLNFMDLDSRLTATAHIVDIIVNL